MPMGSLSIILQLCWIYNQFKIQSLNKITKGNGKGRGRPWLEVAWRGQSSFVGHLGEDVRSRRTGSFLHFPPWAECQESFGWLPTGLKPRYSFWRTQDASKLHPEGLSSQNALLLMDCYLERWLGVIPCHTFFFLITVKGCSVLCVSILSFFFFLREISFSFIFRDSQKIHPAKLYGKI